MKKIMFWIFVAESAASRDRSDFNFTDRGQSQSS